MKNVSLLGASSMVGVGGLCLEVDDCCLVVANVGCGPKDWARSKKVDVCRPPAKEMGIKGLVALGDIVGMDLVLVGEGNGDVEKVLDGCSETMESSRLTKLKGPKLWGNNVNVGVVGAGAGSDTLVVVLGVSRRGDVVRNGSKTGAGVSSTTTSGTSSVMTSETMVGTTVSNISGLFAWVTSMSGTITDCTSGVGTETGTGARVGAGVAGVAGAGVGPLCRFTVGLILLRTPKLLLGTSLTLTRCMGARATTESAVSTTASSFDTVIGLLARLVVTLVLNLGSEVLVVWRVGSEEMVGASAVVVITGCGLGRLAVGRRDDAISVNGIRVRGDGISAANVIKLSVVGVWVVGGSVATVVVVTVVSLTISLVVVAVEVVPALLVVSSVEVVVVVVVVASVVVGASVVVTSLLLCPVDKMLGLVRPKLNLRLPEGKGAAASLV